MPTFATVDDDIVDPDQLVCKLVLARVAENASTSPGRR
jgi:hypothetical protein